MYYYPNSCLVMFFLFSLIQPLTCESRNQDVKLCETLFRCGNITAGHPFWGGNRQKHCGYPLLKLQCNKNITSFIISNQEFYVLHLNQTSHSLTLARTDLLGPICNSSFASTTLPPEIFELSPTYKTLNVFYYCFFEYHLSSYYCPMRKFISVSENAEYRNSCSESFIVNVPTSFVADDKEEFNMTNLESVLSKGFEVKLKMDEIECQECSSSHGSCDINKTLLLGHKCSPIHPPPPSTASVLHTRCSAPFSCGNQRELFYPFWITGREDCGHPDFKLDCIGEFAEFSISSVRYRILEANYASRVIRLARVDYLNSLCPLNPPNAPFNENVLPFAPETKTLTIFPNCRQDFKQYLPTNVGDFDCDDDDIRNYYVTGNLSSPPLQRIGGLLNEFRGSCNTNVSIHASKSSLDTLERSPSTDNLKKALEEGFQLQLSQECSMCMDSEGACGFNQTQTASGFVCYCVDRTENRTCNSRKKGKSKGAIAGIAAGASVGFAILVVACWFCIIRRRKKTQSAQYTSKDLPITSYSSRDTSRTPTSTTISSSSNHSLLPSISNLPYGSSYYGVQVYSYEELEEATENFSRELGDGGFGTVYYGKLKDGRSVAVKRLYERSLKRVEQFKNEIEILKSLKHPNLVILYGCTSRHSRELLLVYEYISNGTLAEHLHGDHAPLCWSVRLKVAIETASALSYLHKSGIIHRDVKTTNILLDENYQVKVADFGLSRLFPTDQTHISTAPQGTPGYVDPEYYQCYRLNEKSDVYSFGVVLTELISSKEAVDITRHRHDINLANMAISKIQNNALHELVDPSLGFEKDPDVKKRMMSVAELAFRCLQQEREVRPSMDEIVEILEEIQGKNRVMVSPPDVVDVDGSNGGGGDDVGLLRHSVPPPISPETDKWTSSSDTAASL